MQRGSLAVGTVVVVALRAVMSLDARFPRVVADEAAYLSMARLLAGGERWNLGLASTYGPGYSVLLAPWFALGLSPDDLYRAAIVTNVVLGGLTFLAFEALARRLPEVRRPLSAGLATVAASLPALVATTNLAWSDTLSPLVFALLVLALLRLVDRPAGTTTAVLVATTVVGYAVHARFLPLAPVVLGVLVALAVGRRLRPTIAAAGAAGLIAGLALVQLASEAIYDRVYDPGQVTQGINEADRITRLSPLGMSATGQTWYLLASTAGLAGIGALVLGLRATRESRRAWQAGGDRSSTFREKAHALAGPAPLGALACVALGVAAFITSTVFMTDRPRGDHMVYGRYNDLFVGPLVLAGLAALALRRSRARVTALTATTAAIGGAAAALLWTARHDILTGGYLVYPVLGLVAIDHLGPAGLPEITVRAGIGAAVLLGLSLALPRRARGAVLVAVALVACVVGSQRAVDRIDPARQSDPRGFSVVADVLEPGDRLGWLADDDANPIAPAFYRDQLYVPDARSVRLVGAPWEPGPGDRPPEPFLVMGAERTEPAAAGYRLAWVDPGSTLGLWVAPGPRQDALAEAEALLPPGGLVPPDGGDDGEVRTTDGPRVVVGDDATTVQGRLVVTRTSEGPWPTVAPGGSAAGRIRVALRVADAACLEATPEEDCTLADGRIDIGRWMGPELPSVELPFAVTLPVQIAREAPPLRIELQLLREGASRFGPVAASTTR